MKHLRTLVRPLSRRRLLQGLGVALALPPLEAMGAARRGPLRMLVVGFPNGVNLAQWRPTGVGEGFALGPTFAPVAPWKSRLQVLSGFRQKNAEALGDGGGDHARANAAFLTGCHPRKTAGANLRNGISVDQVAAQAIGHATRLPSLELSCVRTRRSGSCDSGYSCAYEYNLSWASESLPMPAEGDPRQVFERLFGAGPPGERQGRFLQRQRQRRSVLDFARAEADTLARGLGGADRRKLDEYLSGLREVERQIEHAEAQPLPRTDRRAPEGPVDDFRAHIRLMFDLLTLALHSDSTRIATLLLANEGNNRSFGEIGVVEGHHYLSHHMKKPDHLRKIARIDRFYMEQFAYLLGKLHAARDSDGRRLLDNAMVLYGGAISDGDRHNHDDLPIVLAGAGGRERPLSRHVQHTRPVPLNNLFLGMLARMGVARAQLGDSTAVYDDF